MTMRCSIERAAISDEPTYEPYLTDVPCYVWADASVEQNEAARIGLVEDWRAVVPKDTDVGVQDRVSSVTDRLGRPIRVRPIEVRGILPRPDHIELVLRQVTT